jgi:hypothetical protein
MIQISPMQGLSALVRNQAHRVLGGALRGGHRTSRWSDEDRRRHCHGILETLSPCLGDVTDRVGLEIGPGDNLGVCELLLQAGCRRMYALEKFAHPTFVPDGVQLIRLPIESLELPEPVDFAISNDVLEHVDDVPLTMQRMYAALRPGGVSASSIDLRGHNLFKNESRPLNHLTAPDWLYDLLTSHIETSNRVRCSELHAAARSAGFNVERSDALALADVSYLNAVRPHLLPRYRQLADDDLEVLQLLLVLRKPPVET